MGHGIENSSDYIGVYVCVCGGGQKREFWSATPDLLFVPILHDGIFKL